MVNGRNETTKALCTMLIDKIQTNLNNIYTDIKSILQDHYLTVLEIINGKCFLPLGYFTTLKAFINYYDVIYSNLDKWIDQYCERESIPVNTFDENKRNLYKYYVLLYVNLAKQQYLLNEMQMIDYSGRFVDDINKLKLFCKKSTEDQYQQQQLQAKEAVAAINTVISAITETIAAKAYPRRRNIPLNPPSNPSAQPWVREVEALLQALPSATILNDLTEKFEHAHQQHNKNDIKTYTQDIQQKIAYLHSQNHMLQQVCRRFLQQQECMTQELLAESDLINNNIITAAKMPWTRVMRFLLAMIGPEIEMENTGYKVLSSLSDNFTKTCNLLSTTNIINRTLGNDPWRLLRTNVHGYVGSTVKALDEFTNTYRIFYDDMKYLVNALDTMQKDVKSIDANRMQLAAAIDKLKTVSNMTHDSIVATQGILQSFLTKYESTFTKFIRAITCTPKHNDVPVPVHKNNTIKQPISQNTSRQMTMTNNDHTQAVSKFNFWRKKPTAMSMPANKTNTLNDSARAMTCIK